MDFLPLIFSFLALHHQAVINFTPLCFFFFFFVSPLLLTLSFSRLYSYYVVSRSSLPPHFPLISFSFDYSAGPWPSIYFAYILRGDILISIGFYSIASTSTRCLILRFSRCFYQDDFNYYLLIIIKLVSCVSFSSHFLSFVSLPLLKYV